MKSIHPYPGDVQRPCFAILYRCPKCYGWQSDFRGSITLEDGRFYTIGLSVGIDRNGEEIPRLYLQPPLAKTPVTPGKLEVVGSSFLNRAPQGNHRTTGRS